MTEAVAAGEEQPRDLSTSVAKKQAASKAHGKNTLKRDETRHLLALSRVALYLANGMVYWPGVNGRGTVGKKYKYLAPRM